MAVYKYNYFIHVYEQFNVLLKKTFMERVDRPKAPVVFSYKGKKTEVVWALLDSGADKIVLSHDIASFLKIDLSKSPEFVTEVVGGSTIKIKRHEIDIIYEGQTYTLEADFSDSHRFPILGRSFFNEFESVNFKEPQKIVEIIKPSKSN